MEYKSLKIEKDNGVATVLISRPEALNALNSDVLEELECAVYELENDADVNVVVLSGDGKAFVAGADISEMAGMQAMRAEEFARLGQAAFDAIENMSKPVIAAINGFALGGGCELALACDIRIASAKAKLGQPEVGLGVTPGFGGTQRLPRIVGRAKAKELIFTGKVIKADEALTIGLVNSVVEPEQLMEVALEMAREIASKGQVSVRLSKDMIDRGIETDLNTGLKYEAKGFGLCFTTEDQKEGMSAFLEKRKADFKGR